MTKYKRSKDKLVELTKQVFSVSDISIDTRVIVLLLAGTIPSRKFKTWIDRIDQLNPLNLQYKQINALRFEFGASFRNFIILSAMQAVEHDICSAELQQFISGSLAKQQQEYATGIISIDDLHLAMQDDSHVDQQNLVLIKQLVQKQLMQKLIATEVPQLQMIMETYLHCRKHAQPGVVVHALVHAIADILRSEDLELELALAESKKIVSHALDIFFHKKDFLTSRT